MTESKLIEYTPDPIDQYIVLVHFPEDWEEVHNYIINENNIDGIPNRKITCHNDMCYSLTTAIYLLSSEEAELLKTHPKILDVQLDPSKYPQTEFNFLHTKRYKKNIAFPKPIIHYTADGYTPSVGFHNGERGNNAHTFLTNPSSEPYVGVGIGSTDTVNSDVSYSLTGKGVDAIVIDSGIGQTHIEFKDNNGIWRAKDLILDGPYEVDPEYFESNNYTYNIVIDDVNLRVGIATTAAEDWWEDSSKRSAKFSSLGTQSVINSYQYYHASTVDPKGEHGYYPIRSSHGTQCASQIGGKSYGLAYECNLWSIRAIGAFALLDTNVGMNCVTIWHNAKKINSNDPNPTIVNNSWGSSSTAGNSNGTTYHYKYRGIDKTYVGNGDSDQPPQGTGPCQVQGRVICKTSSGISSVTNSRGRYQVYGSGWAALDSAAIVDLINAGVIVVTSSGNDNQKLSDKNDPDYGNQYGGTSMVTGSSYYMNKVAGSNRGFIGDDEIGKGVIRVGAIDCAVEPSDEQQGNTKYSLRKASYSNCGPMIDIWAPSTGTLAAYYSSSSNYPKYQREDDSQFYDYFFSGTSSACPHVVSVLCLFLQSNRKANQDAARHWLINCASKEGLLSDTYVSGNSGDSTDLTNNYWQSTTYDEPTVDYESYNQAGCGNLRGAPNRVLYNPYANDTIPSFSGVSIKGNGLSIVQT